MHLRPRSLRRSAASPRLGVLPLGSGSALAFDCDKFCGLRGSVHLRSKWTRSISVSPKNKDVLLSHLCPDGYQRTLTLVLWSLDEICRIVKDHRPATKLAHIQETDILRASGPLRRLGVTLGGFVGKGYDCFSRFEFLKLSP